MHLLGCVGASSITFKQYTFRHFRVVKFFYFLCFLYSKPTVVLNRGFLLKVQTEVPFIVNGTHCTGVVKFST